MTTCLGIDVGTSAIKAVLVDGDQTVVAEAAVRLDVQRPRALWSEQDPQAWWSAVEAAVARLKHDAPQAFGAVRAIGLSGQMHGAVLLGSDDRPLRHAILWNDGRSFAEAEALNRDHAALPSVTGVLAMPGFTAPKLVWLARHEPETFAAIRTVLLPKDYVRVRLTGERVTEMSDAAGTWWLDEAARDWSDAALAATGLDRRHMPRLVEGSEPAGMLRAAVAEAWGLPPGIVVAGGAGDAAAGAIGLGAVQDGAAFVSLGTSGQLFVTTSAYRPAPETLVHAFAHAVPRRWFQMGAMLNGASVLAFTAELLGSPIAELLVEAEAAFYGPSDLLMLPYLTGERTPHNDPHARGVIFGLTPSTSRADLIQAALEGVAFSFADAKLSLERSGTRIEGAGVIGGGARSALLVRILANVLRMPLTRYSGGDKGPAFGAARLARLALTREPVETVCTQPPVLDVTEPDAELAAAYGERLDSFRRLYATLKPEFPRAAGRAMAI
ncbi:MAG TPA: xylulokinase [Microvirga sp.]|nr:xylulokinase [Microvirga sp.]